MRGSTADKRGRIAALLATLAAPAVLYLIARAAAVSLSPIAASALPPVDHSAALSPALTAALLPNYKPDPRFLRMADQTAVAVPTWYGAHVFKAKAAEQQGRIQEAIVLLEEVRRRRPKFLPARLLLITHYAKVGRYTDLVDEMDYGLRYSADTRRLLLPELVKLVADPGGRQAIATMLARNPNWETEFYQAAEARKLSPADVLALLRLRERAGGDLKGERELLVSSLVDAGRYAEARALWLQSLPADERRGHALLFNGSFRKIDAQPAFNWRFQNNEVGRAEIASAAGAASSLDVGYFGGSNIVLAEQKTALPPGRYALSVTAQIQEEVRSGSLLWVMTCLPDSPELARLDMTRVGPRPRVVRTAFTVPAGCKGQTLRLVAEPGEIAVPINAQVLKMGIDREG